MKSISWIITPVRRDILRLFNFALSNMFRQGIPSYMASIKTTSSQCYDIWIICKQTYNCIITDNADVNEPEES